MGLLSGRFVGVDTNLARTLELRTENIRESSDILLGITLDCSLGAFPLQNLTRV